MDGYKMRWIYELMWLWQSIGIILLILAIFECCAASIFKSLKKRYNLHMAICIAIAAFIIAVIFILRLAGTPMPL